MLKYIKSLVKNVDKDTGEITAIASTENEDRDGDIILNDGWDLKSFKTNPILLWSHNVMQPPIGKVTSISNSKGQLEFKAEFAEDVSDFAKEIAALVRGGFLNTFSVGYIPKQFDDKGRTTMAELLEISLVNVPANSDAQMSRQYKTFQKKIDELESKSEIKELKRLVETVDHNLRIVKYTLNSDKLVDGACKARKKHKKSLLRALRVVDKTIEQAIVLNKGGEKNE